MRWEPSFTWSRAMATQVSQSASSMASRNFFDPLALVRSPDDQERGVLLEGDLRVDRGGAVLGLGLAGRRA